MRYRDVLVKIAEQGAQPQQTQQAAGPAELLTSTPVKTPTWMNLAMPGLYALGALKGGFDNVFHPEKNVYVQAAARKAKKPVTKLAIDPRIIANRQA